jgi:DNA-binding transcriptional MerR regulator
MVMAELDTINEEPLYNIGVVSRMTNISMATLRAWERRYKFPDSERTAGGHRLYSENDVLRLRWVKARIDEGMQTAQAINALRHQEATGHLVLTANVVAPTQPIATERMVSLRTEKLEEGHSHLDVFRVRLTEHLLQRNLEKADEVLGDALAVSTPEDLILKVIGPNIASMGTYWEEGEINVATEHLATNYLRQRLLSWMINGPPPRSTRPIVMACAPGEWHEGSLLVLGALLRRRRWPVSYLGQALPLEDLALFTEQIQPNLIVLVAMTENTAAVLADWPQYLPQAAEKKHPIIGYGGRIFVEQPEWRLKVQGMYLGNSFEDGVSTIERLLVQQRG